LNKKRINLKHSKIGFWGLRSFFPIIACSLLSFNAWAADLYVSTTGSDSNPGTKSAPLKTIAKAASYAEPGTTVHVAPGQYAGGFKTAASGYSTARIRYVSDTKWGAKIVGSGGGHIWHNSGNYVTVDGFELSGAGKTHGLISGPSSVGDDGHHFIATNNYVHDMAVGVCGSGGAITAFSEGGHSRITNNVIRNIAVSLIGKCSTQQGIYISESDSYIANNIISGIAAVGIHQWHGATRSTIVNNTVFNCLWGILLGSGDSRMLPNGSQDNYVANNISVHNKAYGIMEYGLTSRNTYRNNLLYNNPANVMNASGNSVSGTLTIDPQFVSYSANGSGDYHLKSTSPAIDKGSSGSAPTTDLSGNPRPQGAGYDIGAYEFRSPTPLASASPTSLDFGSITLGQSSITKSVTISNKGNAALTFKSNSLVGDFAFGNVRSCTSTLAAGASCTYSVIFKPSVAGFRSGSLNILTSASTSPMVIALSGSGAAIPAPVVSLSATSLTFASLTVGRTSAIQIVTIKNIGNAAMNISSAFVISGDFAFGGTGTCSVGASYAPGASCTASVVFKPKAIGTRTGSLSIRTNASSAARIVTLSGIGR